MYEFDGEDSIYFSIDPDSGVITLARSVDYDTGNTEFVFNVGLSPTPSSKVANCSDMSSLTGNSTRDRKHCHAQCQNRDSNFSEQHQRQHPAVHWNLFPLHNPRELWRRSP